MSTELLQEVKTVTDQVFEKLMAKPELPAPSPVFREKMEAYNEACLAKQRASLIFEMRKEQAKLLGFRHLTSDQMVEMLMGDPHTETSAGAERQNYEYVYFHHSDEVKLKTNWGGSPEQFVRKARIAPWYVPPFIKKELWKVQFGKLDYLKREIPYGVVLRINEVKKLKLFNAFNVLAPMEAWERKTDIDPIIVASLWEMPPKDDGNPAEAAGQVAHYFLAQW